VEGEFKWRERERQEGTVKGKHIYVKRECESCTHSAMSFVNFLGGEDVSCDETNEKSRKWEY
jgi:hypothetical protein